MCISEPGWDLADGRLAFAGADTAIRLWDPARGRETARLGHVRPVLALAALPDGCLASSGDDCTVRVWDPAYGTEPARLEGHSGSVSALTVLSDGRLASGGDDRTIRLWDPGRGARPRVWRSTGRLPASPPFPTAASSPAMCSAGCIGW
jgi:WD40 repeat protein